MWGGKFFNGPFSTVNRRETQKGLLKVPRQSLVGTVSRPLRSPVLGNEKGGTGKKKEITEKSNPQEKHRNEKKRQSPARPNAAYTS